MKNYVMKPNATKKRQGKTRCKKKISNAQTNKTKISNTKLLYFMFNNHHTHTKNEIMAAEQKETKKKQFCSSRSKMVSPVG